MRSGAYQSPNLLDMAYTGDYFDPHIKTSSNVRQSASSGFREKNDP